MTGTKDCRKCGQNLPISGFYKHKEMKDGHLNICIECTKIRVRNHREENDSVREYDRKRYREDDQRRASTSTRASLWRKRNPEAYKAHTMVSNAIRDGRLKKMSCDICGSKQSLHAHHEDYSRPLNVVWLCAKHHHRHHAKKEG